MRQFIRNAITDIGKYLGYSKKNENPTEERKLKIYCYSGWVNDELGENGAEYTQFYMLSTQPISDFKHCMSDVGLRGSMELNEREISKLSGLEEKAINKRLFKKFGFRNLKAVNGRIMGPFYKVYKDVYDLLESKRD